MAMVTSNIGKELWPEDVPINHLKPTGLKVASLIRLKIFTIDHRLVKRRLGSLHADDVKTLKMRLKEMLEI